MQSRGKHPAGESPEHGSDSEEGARTWHKNKRSKVRTEVSASSESDDNDPAPKRFSCAICAKQDKNFVGSDIETLAEHARTVHRSDKRHCSCPVCLRSMLVTSIKRHLVDIHISPGPRVYELSGPNFEHTYHCEVCNNLRPIPDLAHLYQHTRSSDKHRAPDEIREERSEVKKSKKGGVHLLLICPLCENLVWSHCLEIHLRTTHVESNDRNTYTCTLCDESYKGFVKFLNHTLNSQNHAVARGGPQSKNVRSKVLCALCKKAVLRGRSKGGILLHYQKVHQIPSGPPPEESEPSNSIGHSNNRHLCHRMTTFLSCTHASSIHHDFGISHLWKHPECRKMMEMNW